MNSEKNPKGTIIVTVRGYRRSLTEVSTVLRVSKQGIFLGVEKGGQLLQREWEVKDLLL